MKILRNALIGALSGVGAAWTMARFQKGAGPQLLGRLAFPNSEEPATVLMAKTLYRTFRGNELPEAYKAQAGQLIHYLMGAATGVFYGLLFEEKKESKHRMHFGRGLMYGTEVWAMADELAVPLAGFSRSPREYPLPVHLYGLASHWVYGLTLGTLSDLAGSLAPHAPTSR